MEGIGWPTMNAAEKKASDDAITFAMCELKRALNKTVPGSLQYFTADTGYYRRGRNGECVILHWLFSSCSALSHIDENGVRRNCSTALV